MDNLASTRPLIWSRNKALFGEGQIKKIISLAAVILLVACGQVSDYQTVQVTFSTKMGDIEIDVYEEAAPETSAYFLEFAEQGAFNGKTIYRAGTLPDAPDNPRYIEGGMLSPFVSNPEIRSMADTGLPMLDVLEHENITGLKIERGSVFLGRNVLGNGEVVPDFVIALGPLPEFEYGGYISPDQKGFPVFATVIDGMEIVDTISQRPRDGETHFPFLKGQVLTDPIEINATTVTR